MRLLDVPPTFSAEDKADGRALDSVVFRERHHGDAASRVTVADSRDGLGGQFGDSVAFASWNAVRAGLRSVRTAMRIAPFRAHVCIVVGFGTDEQVGRVDAGAVVAPVQDAQAGRDIANVESVRSDMRADGSTTAPPEAYRPVSGSGKGSGPFPAAPEFRAMRRDGSVSFDALPETILKRSNAAGERACLRTETRRISSDGRHDERAGADGTGKMYGHRVSPSLGVCPRSVSADAGVSSRQFYHAGQALGASPCRV
jgi:hypothetical protein